MPNLTLPAQIGRFLIRRELGRGMMGVVYEAHDSRPRPHHRAQGDPAHLRRDREGARKLRAALHDRGARRGASRLGSGARYSSKPGAKRQLFVRPATSRGKLSFQWRWHDPAQAHARDGRWIGDGGGHRRRLRHLSHPGPRGPAARATGPHLRGLGARGSGGPAGRTRLRRARDPASAGRRQVRLRPRGLRPAGGVRGGLDRGPHLLRGHRRRGHGVGRVPGPAPRLARAPRAPAWVSS